MLRHIVLFKMLDPTDADECISRLDALADRIPSLLSLVTAKNVRQDNPASFHLALITTHEDLAGLKAYQEDALHREFVTWLDPRVATRAVVDHY